jgi:pimeloyl-ACP methyl ester carboxylesterase
MPLALYTPRQRRRKALDGLNLWVSWDVPPSRPHPALAVVLILTAAVITHRTERNRQLMPTHHLGPGDGLHFEHRPPAAGGGPTFVFFNALTGDAVSWEAAVAPALRAEGHGTLLWNFRGQKDRPFAAPDAVSARQIVADAVTLLAAQAPRRPVYVGLSIGGLFAAQAHLAGAPCAGLLLINTLRKAGPRLEWVNAAVHRAALTGGGRLIQDLYLPLLSGPAWQAANRGNFLHDQPYEPLHPSSGTALLLAAGKGADWDLPYERLTMPVTVLSGLQDRVFFDAADVAELRARLPDAERIDLPDTGHLVTLERPQVIVEACRALAARVI